MQRIILASGSPRRKDLMEAMGLKFQIIPSDFDETCVTCYDVREYVQELALQKAMVVVKKYKNAVVIGADTVIEYEGEVIGKPKDEKDAKRIMKKLSGTTHRVLTGVAVIDAKSGKREVKYEESKVSFRKMTEKEIEEYAKGGYWRGFAGGYAIQLEAGKFLEKTEGSYTNILGLPVVMLEGMLRKVGVKVEKDAREVEKLLESKQ